MPITSALQVIWFFQSAILLARFTLRVGINMIQVHNVHYKYKSIDEHNKYKLLSLRDYINKDMPDLKKQTFKTETKQKMFATGLGLYRPSYTKNKSALFRYYTNFFFTKGYIKNYCTKCPVYSDWVKAAYDCGYIVYTNSKDYKHFPTTVLVKDKCYNYDPQKDTLKQFNDKYPIKSSALKYLIERTTKVETNMGQESQKVLQTLADNVNKHSNISLSLSYNQKSSETTGDYITRLIAYGYDNSKENRPYLRLNNKTIVELDIKASWLSMLHCMAYPTRKLPTDAYELFKGPRNDIKWIVNLWVTTGIWKQTTKGKIRMVYPAKVAQVLRDNGNFTYNYNNLKELCEEVSVTLTHMLQKATFKGKSLLTYLKDRNIYLPHFLMELEGVIQMRALTLLHGEVVAIPNNDSFIVPKGEGDKLLKAYKESFKLFLGQEPIISVK